MPTTYKLTYFNGRGRAETIRLIFIAAGVKFEDNRIEGKDWPNLKPKTPWGQLPLLEIDGGKKVVAQSMGIARYVARETGQDGKTSLEKAMCDSVVDAINDLSEPGFKLEAEKDRNKKAELDKEFTSKTAPTILGNLEQFLGNNNGGAGFLVGNSVTWADMHFYSVMERFTEKKLLDSYPLLNGLFQRLAEQPRIKEYLKNRADTSN